MGASKPKMPQPSPQERAMQAQQAALMTKQSQYLDEQRARQAQERVRLVREQSDTAAQEAEARSRSIREGVMAQSVGRAGYGGYDKDRGGYGRGVSRTYTPPPMPLPQAGGGGAGGGRPQRGEVRDPVQNYKWFRAGHAIQGEYGLTSGQIADAWLLRQSNRARADRRAYLAGNPQTLKTYNPFKP